MWHTVAFHFSYVQILKYMLREYAGERLIRKSEALDKEPVRTSRFTEVKSRIIPTLTLIMV